MNAWLILGGAGIAEIAWVIGLRYSAGFTKLWPSVFTVATVSLSMFLLAWAVKTLPLGSAYAVWTGIGAIGVAIAGMIWFGESTNPARLACILLIVAGVAGLKFLAPD